MRKGGARGVDPCDQLQGRILERTAGPRTRIAATARSDYSNLRQPPIQKVAGALSLLLGVSRKTEAPSGRRSPPGPRRLSLRPGEADLWAGPQWASRAALSHLWTPMKRAPMTARHRHSTRAGSMVLQVVGRGRPQDDARHGSGETGGRADLSRFAPARQPRAGSCPGLSSAGASGRPRTRVRCAARARVDSRRRSASAPAMPTERQERATRRRTSSRTTQVRP